MSTSKSLVEEFLAHFNARNQDGLLALVDADLTYNGRHGEGEGVMLLREWVDRATTTMTPRRWFGHDNLSVVEVDVEWRSPKSNEITDRATWALSITTDDDHILAISRYADVGEAVTKMGLVPEDILPEMVFPD